MPASANPSPTAPPLALPLSVPLPSAAFWQTKKTAVAKILDGEVLVNVKTKSDGLILEGGGHVHAPANHVFAFASDFSHIEHLGLYVDRAHYDPVKGVVDLTITALGLVREFRLRVAILRDAEPKRIHLEIISGPMTGIKTQLWFKALAPKLTEVGLRGDYKDAGGSVTKTLHALAIETVLKRVALRLRQGVESEKSASASAANTSGK